MRKGAFRPPLSHSPYCFLCVSLFAFLLCDSHSFLFQFLSCGPHGGNQFGECDCFECDNRAIRTVNLVTVGASPCEVSGQVPLAPVVPRAPAADNVARVAVHSVLTTECAPHAREQGEER